MNSIYRKEWRLLVRSRLTIVSLVLLAAFTSLSLLAGIAEIEAQQETLHRLDTLQAADLQRVMKQNVKDADAGSAAYYSYHATWDPPSSLAFAAIGQRDIVPYSLRVNALGLQAQLYGSEQFNPEARLAGRFDFAFVLVYLVPLFVIGMFHDLFSGEREAGRLRLLLCLAGGNGALWRRRALLRFALLVLAVLVPFIAASIVRDVPMGLLAGAVGVVLAYIAFWCALALLLARVPGTSATHAARLLGVWTVLTLVLPALARVAIDHAIPAGKGVDLALAHREAVHGSWERPREEIMQRFVQSHPEWRDRAQLTEKFAWKWYYAFHQLADESVADQAALYRRALEARQQWTERAAVLLPSVAVHTLLHRMADTDLPAQLDYLDQISKFHAQLRAFYYPYLFEERPFVEADYGKAPAFAARTPGATVEPMPAISLGLLTLLFAVLAGRVLEIRDFAGVQPFNA
jgi:ABC-2 type transport system permease protein